MADKLLDELQEMKTNLQNIDRSPTQLTILIHFIYLNTPLKINDIAKDLKITYKAAARAIDKLRSKNLISRNSLLKGYYDCNLKRILPCLLLMLCDLYKDLKKEKSKR